MRINKILVPIDFSECSNNALNFAISIAQKANSKLYLIHGFAIPVPMAEISLEMQPLSLKDYEQLTQQNFKKLKAEIPMMDWVEYEQITAIGFPVDAIIDASHSFSVDLIVMGTKGAGNKIEELLGSNTVSVMEKADCPLLAVPEGAKYNDIRKIAFATDFTIDNEASTFDLLGSFAKMFDAKMYIINVSKSPSSIDLKKAEEALNIYNYFKSSDVAYSFDFSENTNIEEGINRFVSKNNIDMLIMMPHKYGFFEKIFRKRVSRKMALHINLPLLTFH